MVVGNNESMTTKNAGKLLEILIAMHMRRYKVGHIAWFRTSRASFEANGSGEFLRRIAPAATMVDSFIETASNTNKTKLLASNYATFRSLVVYENFTPQNRPTTQLIDATSFVEMWNVMIGDEELMDISSYQILSGDKK